MRATGIVRRIDDLGRVVIPKEIRRTLRIREGDALEIFTESDGEVIFKKYSPICELSGQANIFADILSKNLPSGVIITDYDAVVAATGTLKKELAEKPISRDVEQLLSNRQIYIYKEGEMQRFTVTRDEPRVNISILVPIISSGDVIGSAIYVLPDTGTAATDYEVRLFQVIAAILGKAIETN